MSGVAYLRQLYKRWGLRAPRQLLRMIKLHRTPYDKILHNIFSVMEKYDGKFTFPIVAAVARMRPDLVREIAKEGHEIASHGFNHLRYPTISPDEREKDLELSLHAFRKLGVKIKGFRAPYNNYTDDMPQILEKLNIMWDGGYGRRVEHRQKTHFFRVLTNGAESKVTYIPLNTWSDDLMIDKLGMGPDAVTKRLNIEVKKASESGGVLMFDLHPIRVGQSKYMECLGQVTESSISLGGWCTTPSEAISYWNSHGRWKGDASFCLLFTGDIDNWVFSDYLRRIIWRRQTR